MFSIIKATPQYLSDIYSMILALAKHDGSLDRIILTEKQLGELLFCNEPKHFISMALKGSALAGIVLYDFVSHNVCYNITTGIYIEMFYVDPKFRNQGIGSALFNHVAKEALEKSCSRVEWWVSANNHLAQKFYQKLEPTVFEHLLFYKCDRMALEKLIKKGTCA